MSQGQGPVQKRKRDLKERIRKLLENLDAIMPYAIIGGGLAATQAPEAFKAVEALLLAYILSKGALQSLNNPKAKQLAEKIAKDTEEALQELGVNKESIKSLENQA